MKALVDSELREELAHLININYGQATFLVNEVHGERIQRLQRLLGYFQPSLRTDDWQSPVPTADSITGGVEVYLMKAENPTDIDQQALLNWLQEGVWLSYDLDEMYHTVETWDAFVAHLLSQVDVDALVAVELQER